LPNSRQTIIAIPNTSSALLLHVVDWGQTLWIADPKNGRTETNLILGEHPSRGEVNQYFLLSGIAHVAIANWLPTKTELFGITMNPRRIWQATRIGIEIDVVNGNRKAHGGFKFDF